MTKILGYLCTAALSKTLKLLTRTLLDNNSIRCVRYLLVYHSIIIHFDHVIEKNVAEDGKLEDDT